MRGGDCCGSPFLYVWEVLVIETWRRYWAALSARQRALVGALLLCALSGVYLLQADSPQPVAIVQHIEKAPPATEIRGLSAAAKRPPLRNPFSDAHERAHEVFSATTVVEQKGQTLPPDPSPVPSTPPTAAVPPVPPPAPLVLRGVVTGADGVRIAILARGEEGAALGIGEMWQGYTLRALSDRSATLDSASGTITLTRE